MTGMSNLSAPGFVQFGDRVKHDHPDTGHLTIGCTGCIKRVRSDQEVAAWRDAPFRRCTWRFNIEDRDDSRKTGWLSFTIDVRVPAGVESWEVDEQYMGETGHLIDEACKKAGIDDDEAIWKAAHTIRCSIGEIVPGPTEPAVQEPTLF